MIGMGAIALALALVALALAYVLLLQEERGPILYDPTVELPDDYMVLTAYPSSEVDLQSIASLTPLIMGDGIYHPFLVLDPDGGLSRQQLFTLTHLRTDRPKVLFQTDPSTIDTVNDQLREAGLSEVGP